MLYVPFKLSSTCFGVEPLLIIFFLTATIVTEISGNLENIVAVKKMIFYGIFLLIPVMASVGISGKVLAGKGVHERIKKKMHRMKLIAMNAFIILIPSVVILHILASSGEFGITFKVIQTIEFFMGLFNIILILLNIMDGINLRRTRSVDQ